MFAVVHVDKNRDFDICPSYLQGDAMNIPHAAHAIFVHSDIICKHSKYRWD